MKETSRNDVISRQAHVIYRRSTRHGYCSRNMKTTWASKIVIYSTPSHVIYISLIEEGIVSYSFNRSVPFVYYKVFHQLVRCYLVFIEWLHYPGVIEWWEVILNAPGWFRFTKQERDIWDLPVLSVNILLRKKRVCGTVEVVVDKFKRRVERKAFTIPCWDHTQT